MTWIEFDQAVTCEIDALVGAEVADGHADVVDLALATQIVECFEPIEMSQAVAQPAVELVEIDAFNPEAFERSLDVLPQMPTRVPSTHIGIAFVRRGPDDRLRFGRDVNLVAFPFLQRSADHDFAVALAVEFSGVDEIDTLLVGVKQRVDRLPVVYCAPVAADLPCAETDLADLPASSPENPIFHEAFPSARCFCCAL